MGNLLPAAPDSLLASALADGEIRSVACIAKRVLGNPISAATILRWSSVGRRGIRLPTIRGVRRKRLTTELAFRLWLEATSDSGLDGGGTAGTKPTAPQIRDEAADALLASVCPRLARREGKEVDHDAG